MASVQHVVIEIFIILVMLNTTLGVVTLIYQEKEPTESLRSSFDAFPLGSNFTSLDTESATLSITGPTNSTGDQIPWVTNAIQDFNATISVLITFSAFFTLDFITQLLTTLGSPPEFHILITAPLSIYSLVMIFSIITGRLRG